MKRNVKNVLAMQAELGECRTWLVAEQALWCVDILAPAIHRFDPHSGALETFPLQEDVGCSGVWLLDAQGKPQRKVADNPGEAAKSRFNDGRVDPWGNFWCGSL
nr:hypothetical protein [Candidatus Pantoea persica]